MQRRYAAMEGCHPVNIVDVRDVGNIGDVNRVEAVAKGNPTGEEAIAGADGQPAESPPSPKPHSKAEAPAPSEERNVRRRPQRTIEAAAPHRSGPPRPRVSIHHPASVVIRRPA